MVDSRWSRRDGTGKLCHPHSRNVQKPTIRVNTYFTHRLSFLTPHFQSFSKCPSSSSLILQGEALIKLIVKEQDRIPDGVILSDTCSLPYHQKIPSHIAALRATLQNMKFADRTEEYAAWIVLRIAIDDGVWSLTYIRESKTKLIFNPTCSEA